jgi:peroxiredoxin Q/BCP
MKPTGRAFRFVATCWLAAVHAGAIEVGQPVPDVGAPSTSGQTIRLADLKGTWVVLYFYPKSFTSGCTKEACSLRDGYAEIQKLGAVLLGSSFDDLETQKRFKAEHNLPFELLSDEKKTVARGFDAVSLGGLVSSRKTFLIDPEGRVAHIFSDVNVGGHDAEVAEALKRLQAESEIH